MKNPPDDAFSRLLRTRLARAGTSFFFSKPASLLLSQPYNPENEEIGFQFEKFVVSKFNEDHFTLLEWRSDKQLDGRFPKACQLPDLEFYFNSEHQPYHFAVECKWRRYFKFDSVEWATDSQFHRYREYQNQTKIPVFIVLGIGGEADKPNAVYCIPLNEIDNTILHEFAIAQYRRKSHSDNFFINPTANKLT